MILLNTCKSYPYMPRIRFGNRPVSSINSLQPCVLVYKKYSKAVARMTESAPLPPSSEVSTLRQSLHKHEMQRNSDEYRMTIQKVVASMTQGIDVSSLFGEMVKASATQDIRQKKLVYLYICRYADENQVLSLMAINTLQKDMSDQNPTVRGLALRSLCSLKLKGLPEFARAPLKAGLMDKSAYVRRVAVLSAAKLYRHYPQLIQELNMASFLYSSLKDKDPQVVVNSICALNEILASEGGAIINRNIAAYLLHRFNEFSEWGQAVVLESLTRYKVQDEAELMDLLNRLDSHLETQNTGVLMAVIKLFISSMDDTPQLQGDAAVRIRPVLLNIVSSSCPEICYSALAHIEVLLEKLPSLSLQQSHKSFYCRYSDPAYVKVKKVEILAGLVSDRNMREIINELSEAALDSNTEVGRRAVNAIKTIALRHSNAVELCLIKFGELLTIERPHIITVLLVSSTTLVRKYPDTAGVFVSQIPELVRHVEGSVEGRACLVWLLGEFGRSLPESPYILEEYINSISQEADPGFKLNLLSAAMKLFLNGRAPEMQLSLGRLIAYCVEEEMDMDVHDRGLLYYRMLRENVYEAQKIFSKPAHSADMSFDLPMEQQLEFNSEFNSLSVIYTRPASHFITQVPPYVILPYRPPDNPLDELPARHLISELADLSASPELVTSPPVEEAPLLDIGLDPEPVPPPAEVPSDMFDQLLVTPVQDSAAEQLIQLLPEAKLPPNEFERLWKSIASQQVVEFKLAVLPTPKELKRTAQSFNITLMAWSPPQIHPMKCFLYAQHVGGSWLLIQTLISADGYLKGMIKVQESALSDAFMTHFKNSFIGSWMPPDI